MEQFWKNLWRRATACAHFVRSLPTVLVYLAGESPGNVANAQATGTGGVSDVNSDLTIDLNGHELQRNNRDPVLNVTDGVRLTIKDSKGGGCFYNPVGSALRVSGGTLTVTSGIFESGPRTGHGYQGGDGFIDANYRYAGEYVTGNTSAAGATIGSAEDVTYYKPEKPEGGAYVIDTGIASMPIITPNVQKVTENNEKRFRINGNMYFENDYSSDASEPTIPADTYLYYTISGANVENTNMAATDKSADFYYTYYVTQNADGTVSYEGTTEGTDTLLVTIYGYTGVKGDAEKDDSNFAAIQMEDGYLDVQGGRYTAYFGKGETNCVYASGGEMTVQNGAFEALQSGVCVRMASQSTSAAAGELAVRSGSFYSEEGDTIFVTGGNMSVTGGAFTKNTDVHDASSQTAAGANNAAIHVSGGKLVMAGAGEDNRITFSLTGSHLYGINVEHGDASTLAEGDMAEISYAAFTFEGVGNNNYAINSANAAVSVENTNFTFGGESTSNRCISVSGESAKASVSTATFTYNGGSSNYAIVSTEQGEVEGTDLTFEFLKDKDSASGNENVGIYSSGGVVTLKKGDFMYEGGDNHYAVYSKGGTVTGTDLSFAFNGDGSSNTGIYTTGGTVSLTHGTFNFNEGATGETSGNKGIHSKGGKVEVMGDGNTFIFNADASSSRDNFGIYSEKVTGGDAGTIDADTITCNNSTFTINGSYSAGILAFGGTVTLGGTFDCTVEDGRRLSLDDPTNVLTSTAISVEGGTVNLNAVSTITTNGLGITSLPGEGNAESKININGNLTLAPLNNNDNGTAIYLNGGALNIAEDAIVTITCNLAKNGTTALRWADAPDDTTHDTTTVATIDPNNGIYVNGGSLKSYGTLNVTHTGVQSDIRDDNGSYYTYENQPIKSYAVRVSAQENSSSTSEVVISSGKIKNSIGGGVYVGGGTVTLGTENDALENGDLTIETTGMSVDRTFQWVNGTSGNWTYERWRYGLNLEGGHAVEVDGGNLTVNGGSYSAKQGNGIFVRNTSNNVSGSVVVNAGDFIGYNEGQVELKGQKGQMLGPAASYGLNVMGGGSVNIYGGTFGKFPSPEATGTYSGAAIAGNSTTHRANATIYSGKFYGRDTDAFSVFFYADVSFGGKDENGKNMGDDSSITVYSRGAVAGISIQDGYGGIENQNNSTSSLSIYYGSYYTYLYFGHNATLNIYGGEFDVTNATYDSTTQDHIINFGKYATNNKISISGGHFKATSSAFQASDYVSYYSHIIASDHNAYDSDGNTVWGIIQSSREPEIWVRYGA